jgi:SAM-dependent methyltransferase
MSAQSRERLIYSFRWSAEDTLAGWVFDVGNPTQPLLISIFLNDVLFQVMRCAELVDRSSIKGIEPKLWKDWVKNTSQHKVLAGAFSYRVPDYVPRRSPVKVTIRHHESQRLLFEETHSLDAEARQILTALAEHEPYVRMHADQLKDRGLTVVAQYFGSERCHLVSSDGVVLAEAAQKQMPHPDGFFTFWESAALQVVQGRLDISGGPRDPIEIRLQRVADGHPIGDGAAVFSVPPNVVEVFATWRKPEPFRVARVMGTEVLLDYFFTGYSTFKVVEHVLQQAAGKPLMQQRRILDWGCGVARLSQHLLRWTTADVLGIDIDASAVDWCSSNLPSGRFEVAPLDPPTNIPSASIDLIIGISVFTHLDEATQDAWLGELQRILAPEGTIVATICAFRSLFVHPHATIEFSRMQLLGISDDAIGSLLDDVLPEGRSDYYRETKHSHDYIVAQWSRWFDVVAIFPGAHFNHQDYVVLRHRSAAPPRMRIEALNRLSG